MGCSGTKETIESEMLMLKLQRVLIEQQKQEKIKQLEEITHQPVKRKEVPDYIDQEEMRRKTMLIYGLNNNNSQVKKDNIGTPTVQMINNK